MNFGVLGTGMVGAAIGGKLVALGHEVRMGARAANNVSARQWVERTGRRASHGTFAEAAAFGEVLFNCTKGSGSLEALQAAGAANLGSKILVDVSNPLDFTHGPALFTGPGESLAERLQRAFPRLRVVKTLNTVTCDLMVDPRKLAGGDHDLFISGDDPGAKAQVLQLLTEGFGWRRVTDLGDLSTARAAEGYMLLWLRLFGTLKTPQFNVRIVS